MEISPSFLSLGLQVNGHRTGGRRGLGRLGRVVSEAGNAEEPPGAASHPTASPAHSILRAGVLAHLEASPMMIKISEKSLPNYGSWLYQNPYNLDALKVYNLKLWRPEQ